MTGKTDTVMTYYVSKGTVYYIVMTVDLPYSVFDINKPEGPVKVIVIVNRNGRIESVINVSVIN